MRGSNQTHSIEADQSSWMNEVAIAHWAAWYCINIRDEDEIRELITTQFACWKYLKERKTTIPVSGRMKQRAAEFNKFLDISLS